MLRPLSKLAMVEAPFRQRQSDVKSRRPAWPEVKKVAARGNIQLASPKNQDTASAVEKLIRQQALINRGNRLKLHIGSDDARGCVCETECDYRQGCHQGDFFY